MACELVSRADGNPPQLERLEREHFVEVGGEGVGIHRLGARPVLEPLQPFRRARRRRADEFAFGVGHAVITAQLEPGLLVGRERRQQERVHAVAGDVPLRGAMATMQPEFGASRITLPSTAMSLWPPSLGPLRRPTQPSLCVCVAYSGASGLFQFSSSCIPASVACGSLPHCVQPVIQNAGYHDSGTCVPVQPQFARPTAGYGANLR